MTASSQNAQKYIKATWMTNITAAISAWALMTP